jgi:hypothetical protein
MTQKWKIIWVDGFGRESVPERLVAENISNKREADIMLAALTESCSGDESQWYRIVENDRKLWRGMEELI